MKDLIVSEWEHPECGRWICKSCKSIVRNDTPYCPYCGCYMKNYDSSFYVIKEKKEEYND